MLRQLTEDPRQNLGGRHQMKLQMRTLEPPTVNSCILITNNRTDIKDRADCEEDTVKCLIRSVQGVYLSASAKKQQYRAVFGLCTNVNFGIEKQSGRTGEH